MTCHRLAPDHNLTRSPDVGNHDEDPACANTGRGSVEYDRGRCPTPESGLNFGGTYHFLRGVVQARPVGVFVWRAPARASEPYAGQIHTAMRTRPPGSVAAAVSVDFGRPVVT